MEQTYSITVPKDRVKDFSNRLKNEKVKFIGKGEMFIFHDKGNYEKAVKIGLQL